jgi:hypothetical protein
MFWNKDVKTVAWKSAFLCKASAEVVVFISKVIHTFPLALIEMAKTQTRKSGKKSKGTRKGKRTLSPALKAWNEKVMKVYREMKKNNPNTKLGDAMKAAKNKKD